MSEGPEHKRLVKELIKLVESKGFEVRCSSSQGPKVCEEVNGVIPDLKAYSSNKELVLFGEADTDETINTEQTKKQIKVLGNRIMSESKVKVPFYFAIPKGSQKKAEEVIDELGYQDKENIYIIEF